MATACHSPNAGDARARAAETRWRAVVDAQHDDLTLLRRGWPDRSSPAARSACCRLKRRARPGGEADAALAELAAVYGGDVPQDVRRRLEGYVRIRLAGNGR